MAIKSLEVESLEVESLEVESKIFNGTSHKITFFDENKTKLVGRKLFLLDPETKPYKEIPPGIDLNCKTETMPPDLEGLNTDIPIFGPTVYTSIDELPLDENGKFYDLYVVSSIYRAAYESLKGKGDSNIKRLVTIKGPIYHSPEDIRPVGCIGFIKG